MMPRFRVTVSYTQERDLTIYAKDEAEAEDRACEIVEKWDNVTTAEAIEVEPED